MGRVENLPEGVGNGEKKEGGKRKLPTFGNPRWWLHA